MAENLRSFTMDGVLLGLLIFCMSAFVIGFMALNNPTGLNDGTQETIEETYTNTSTYLTEINEDSNNLLNITSNTNPEVGDLGSRDQVATSYSATGTAKGSWETTKNLISWVFTGTTGQILLGVIGGMLGLLSFFVIIKWIRQGE